MSFLFKTDLSFFPKYFFVRGTNRIINESIKEPFFLNKAHSTFTAANWEETNATEKLIPTVGHNN